MACVWPEFFFGSDWNPVEDQYGALPFVYGTIVSSILALLIAIPLSVGVAVFITEMCPKWLKGPLSFFTELLAAIPSVIYGLWAIFVLVPLLRTDVEPALAKTLGWTAPVLRSALRHRNAGGGDDLSDHDHPHHLLHHTRSAERCSAKSTGGRTGLGRHALGNDPDWSVEKRPRGYRWWDHSGPWTRSRGNDGRNHSDGNRPEIAKSLFAPGYTMASVLANEFSEATGDLYLSALIEIGLALFLVTIVVNALARLMVWSVTRGQPARSHV